MQDKICYFANFQDFSKGLLCQDIIPSPCASPACAPLYRDNVPGKRTKSKSAAFDIAVKYYVRLAGTKLRNRLGRTNELEMWRQKNTVLIVNQRSFYLIIRSSLFKNGYSCFEIVPS